MKKNFTLVLLKMFLIFLVVIVSPSAGFSEEQKSAAHSYTTVNHDPLDARIYELKNGLVVYMSVYKDAPRIQTYIAVKVGSKHDPADATGLAHYLEHMLFKGTDRFGTNDFEQEKPHLDSIIELYERYHQTSDPPTRQEIYRQIDTVSNTASQYAIPNEYDKMMTAIGAKGTNAYTSVERTVYANDIPSNQLENWLTVEAERFRNPVMRLFHTELEVVYEEKNRSLDNDWSKAYHAKLAGLFQKHPYGTQTTLGSVEHLKNPSIKKVIDYYNTYYVPNNMAICLSGDFDPDEIIRLIDREFGKLPVKEVPTFIPPEEELIEQPIIKDVYGPDAESVTVAFRFGGVSSPAADLLTMTDMILANGTAGLVDLNLNQGQKVIDAFVYPTIFKDYSIHTFSAQPREGQTLEEVADLLLSQIELVKRGDFSDWLIPAILEDLRLQQIHQYENNWGRAHAFVNAFTLGIPWKVYIQRLERLSKITKQDIIDFANQHYGENYVVVYKRTGEDKNVPKIQKPHITPVEINREDQSDFTKALMARNVPDIAPVFLSYAEDIGQFRLKNDLPVYHVENTENDLFTMDYIWDMGTDYDKKIGVALDYLTYLGTSNYSPAELKQEFYKTGCSFSVFSSGEQIRISLSGLAKNFEKGMALLDELLSDAQPNPKALENLVQDILKVRADEKLSKWRILWQAMYNYGEYGPQSSFTHILSEDELHALSQAELIELIQHLHTYEHRILYYGPATEDALTASLDQYYQVPRTREPIPEPKRFEQLPTTEDKIYVVNYDMQQTEIVMLSKSERFNKENAALRTLFNEYYGGSMSSVVFQTMRESKALAYAVWAGYSSPSKKENAHYVFSYIGTQADKLREAMSGMLDLLNVMPESEASLAASKEAIVKKIQTERITKSRVLFSYERAQKLGLSHDIRKDVFDTIPKLDMEDVSAFHEQYFKGRQYTILVLGDTKKIDFQILSEFGTVEMLTLEDIFGY